MELRRVTPARVPADGTAARGPGPWSPRKRGAGHGAVGRIPRLGKAGQAVAAQAGQPFADALIDIGPGDGQAAHFVMDRALPDRLLLDPHVSLGRDASPGGRQPRSAGTFARWIVELGLRQPRGAIGDTVWQAESKPAYDREGRVSGKR